MTPQPLDQNPDSNPLILAIETATNCGSVALLEGHTCLAENTLNSATTHSRRITSQIDTVMSECAIAFADLDCIAVSLGPGSFTGLRIGLSTAKGLSLACNAPLIGISTLDGLAHQASGSPGTPICIVLDARKKEVYAALYKCDSTGKPLQITADLAIKPEDLAAMIMEPTVFIGNGTEAYGTLLKGELGEKYLPADPAVFMPRASSIGSLALGNFFDEDFADPATMVPVYVRPSEAEVHRNKKLAKEQL